MSWQRSAFNKVNDWALRPVSISTGSISTSDGSAVVKQGDTIVVCGIKLEISEPKTEKPKSGGWKILIKILFSTQCRRKSNEIFLI